MQHSKTRRDGDGEIMRCPQSARFPDDLAGCGSTRLDGPDKEGLYDCLDCGLWFTDEAAERLPLKTSGGG